LGHRTTSAFERYAELFITGRRSISPANLIPAPESDPELSQTAIEFASHLISRAPLVLIHLQPPATAEFFFLFTLRVLDGKEPLPKAAAADFWVSFCYLRCLD
jgi:hypothetical protein